MSLMLTTCSTGSILHQPCIYVDTSLVYVYCLDLFSGHRAVPDGLLELDDLYHNITRGL